MTAHDLRRSARVAEATTDDVRSETRTPTIDLTVKLLAAPSTGLDQAPVDVDVVDRRRARTSSPSPSPRCSRSLGGGYAVEVADGATHAARRRRAGLYADGYVEIDGRGLAEGDAVVVPP